VRRFTRNDYNCILLQLRRAIDSIISDCSNNLGYQAVAECWQEQAKTAMQNKLKATAAIRQQATHPVFPAVPLHGATRLKFAVAFGSQQ
jgi:hypothetical protein